MFVKNLFAGKLAGVVPYKVDTNTYRVRLDANESFFALPKQLRLELENSLLDFNFNRYPDPDAVELVNAFCSFFGVSEKCVAAGNGSDEIISILMNCFIDFGSSVMTFTPDFSMYAFYARLAGAKVIECPKNKDLQIDFDAAIKQIKQNNVKLCIFSNPCNPTGKIEKKSDIITLASLCPDTIFVSDEAYMDFSPQDESFLKDTEKYSNIIVLKTLSKAIGCAALRLGFVVADESFIKMFKAVKSPYNVNGVSQKFGQIVLSHTELLTDCTNDIIRSVNQLSQMLNVQDTSNLFTFEKTYTNFLFMKSQKAKAVWEYLKSNGILVRYFDIDGGALRITAGSMDENTQLCSYISRFGG